MPEANTPEPKRGLTIPLNIGTVLTVVTFVIGIMGAVFAWGQTFGDTKADLSRAEETRAQLTNVVRTLNELERTVGERFSALETKTGSHSADLTEIKRDIKRILRDLPDG